MRDSTRIRTLARWRTGLAIAAFLGPLCLLLLFENQARRLDHLAREGVPTAAEVTRVSGDITYYAYEVEGIEHRVGVARDEAPYSLGDAFTVIYWPTDPSLSRPYPERDRAAAEAAHNRGLAWKVVLGLALFLGLFAFLAHRDLKKRRDGTRSELADPQAYRRRITWTVSAAALLVIGGGVLHGREAAREQESLLPVGLALALSLSILFGVAFFVARHGPVRAQARAGRVFRWLVPVAAVIALLRLLALAFGY